MHSDQFVLMIVDENRDQEKHKLNCISQNSESLFTDTTQHHEDEQVILNGCQ